MNFTDYPVAVPFSRYEWAIEKTVERLRTFPGLIAVYQIGGITEPGISDIDFFVVFEDDAVCGEDPRGGLEPSDRYMIMHSLYGSSRSHWEEVQRYSLFHNYNLLWGEQLPVTGDARSAAETKALKRQIALEYLLKMYTNIVVEMTYGIIRVRSLLLHVKGILYDLEFLDIAEGPMYELVREVFDWRRNWFENPASKKRIRDWLEAFNRELVDMLEENLRQDPVRLPSGQVCHLSQNLRLLPATEFGSTHRGVTLPSQFGFLGRKYFNVQHRFNKFDFKVPVRSAADVPILAERFTFLARMRDYNREHISHFAPAASSLQIL